MLRAAFSVLTLVVVAAHIYTRYGHRQNVRAYESQDMGHENTHTLRRTLMCIRICA